MSEPQNGLFYTDKHTRAGQADALIRAVPCATMGKTDTKKVTSAASKKEVRLLLILFSLFGLDIRAEVLCKAFVESPGFSYRLSLVRRAILAFRDHVESNSI